MSPLQKAASRLHGRNSQTEEDQRTQQSGRSTSNLHAEAAASAVRNAERSPSPASAGNRLSKTPRRAPAPNLAKKIPPPPPPHRHSSSHAPAVSSPLNPSSPVASLKSRDSTSSSDGTHTSDYRSAMGGSNVAIPSMMPRSQSSNALETATNLSRPLNQVPSRGRGPFTDQIRHQHSTPSLRPQNPITVHDLGRDYSRYPFQESPRHSIHGSASEKDSSPNAVHSTSESSRSASSHPSNPFVTPSAPLLDSDPEKSYTLLDDRISGPTPYYAGLKFPMFTDEKELDDDMHMPGPDDDIRFKPHWRDYCHKDGMISLLSLAVMVLALIAVFIILPALTFTGHTYTGPRTQSTTNPGDFVTDKNFPLFKNIRTGLIDPDTPDSAMTRKGVDGDTLKLVWSDEFNQDGRTFYADDDPYWTAPDIWYGATQDLEWYDPDAATTGNGTLALQLDKFQNHNINYRSGMLNSWNQVCFKGGALEVSMSLPGPSGSPGLWPGVWTMGNLGRPGYGASTEGVWPYTYNECDVGITPNQSSPDGISYQPGQKLPSCVCAGEDHPTPGTGRGAPEIDVIEASVDPNNRIGVVTQSFQVAPYDIWYHVDSKFLAIPNEDTTQMNSYCGGPYQQAVSGTTLLNNDWYDEKQYQKYAFEYTPGTTDGQISWFVGQDVSYQMGGNAIGPNGNIGAREVSQEPMSIVLNLGISNSWTWIDWTNLTFPTTMHIDYVRWYQKDGEESVTCDPPGYETTDYIRDHPKAYNNPNLTHWDQTGYGWPKHNLDGSC
ncbi:MAG: hypothetical protein M4579_005863 [Chaenotheca gracillima]|nr:MAG: hypothetical protein M4579_005863 [Chaenotheca gracillima]